MIDPEFLELMPHTLSVKTNGVANKFGRTESAENARKHRCLVDATTTKMRGGNGETVTVSMTIYVFAIPEGEKSPVRIKKDDIIEVLDPEGIYDGRPMMTVDDNYDEDGTLHNQVLRFT